MEKNEAQRVAEATVNAMTNIKPKWFNSHEKNDARDFGDIKATLKSQDIALADMKKAHIELVKIQEEYHQKTLPVFEYLNEITVGRKIRGDYIKATGVYAGIILGVSSVGGVIWAIFKFLVFNAK